MERQQDDTLFKVRSLRGIVKAAARLYTRRFVPMIKAQWPYITATAVICTAVCMMTVYSLYLLVPLAAVGVLTEVVLWLMTARWLTERPLRSLWRSARRHWLLLVSVVVAGEVAMVLPCLLVSLPQAVLILAEWESQSSIELGDPANMPAWMPYLMAATGFVTTALQVCLRLYIVYVGYYAWGSAETRRRERERQKLNMQLPQV